MEIFINTLSPSKLWMTTSVTVQPTDTVSLLIAKLSEQFGSGNHCRFNGEPLPPESTLEECFVVEHSTVFYVKPADTVFVSDQTDSTSTNPIAVIDSVRGGNSVIGIHKTRKHTKTATGTSTECLSSEPAVAATLSHDPLTIIDSVGVENSDIDICKTGKLPETATGTSTESVSSEPAVAATVSDEKAKKTVESSLWDQLVQSKKLADKQEKDLAKTLAKAKCSKGFPVIRYLISGKDAREFLSNHTRFFVVVVSQLQSMDSITKICSAVSVAIRLPVVVTCDMGISKMLAGDLDIDGHFYKCGSKLWVYDSFVLVEKKLLNFLKKCMVHKSSKWLN